MLGVKELMFLLISVVISFVALYIVVGVGDKVMVNFVQGHTDSPLYQSYAKDTGDILSNVGLVKVLIVVIIASVIIGTLMSLFFRE